MEHSLTELLKNSINQIDNLYDYYLSQEKAINQIINDRLKKYKYGIALVRFFIAQAHPESNIQIKSDEENLIETMLDEFEIIKNDETIRIKYKLKDSFNVKEEYELNPNIAKDEVMRLLQQPTILSESVLMMLLIKYEDSISKLFRYLIEKHPDAFLSDKKISYSELMSMKSNIDYIKDRFVDKEIDEIMREPISSWYDSFQKRQKVNFLFEDNVFNSFKEIYYRRNLIVHNQGIVNDSYLGSVNNASVKLGDKLIVDKEYLKSAFSLTNMLLIDTYFGMRKFSTNKEEFENWIIDYGYDCLVEKKWSQAKYIFKVILQDKDMQSLNRLVCRVNYWIAVKKTDGIDAIIKEVDSLDVSALQLPFHVAKAALLDDNEAVLENLEKCIDNNEISSYYIKTWPLLEGFRNSTEYQILIDKHKEYMEIDEFNPTNEGEQLQPSTNE